LKIRTRTSCGEKPPEGACSEREHAFHPGNASSSASHKSQVGEEVEFQVAVFNAKGVDTKSETSHTVNDISRKVKKHVSGKPIRRMGNQISLCRQCAPLVISVLQLRSIGWPSELSTVAIRKRCYNF
jgi:hypothetical protein